MKCLDCNGTGMFDDGSGERTLTRCQTCEGSGLGQPSQPVQIGMMTRNVRFLDANDIDNIFRIATASEDEKQPYKPGSTKL